MIKINKMHIIGIVLAVLLAIAGIFLTNLRYLLFISSGIIILLPFLIGLISSQRTHREKEEMFLVFLRDLVENVKSGTPINKSILNLRKREYRALSPHIEKLSNQIGLGIPLSSALRVFSEDTGSQVISRAVSLISEAEKAGGRIDTILDSVANSVNQIEILRKERKSSIANLVTQGYLIFLAFVIIMLVLQFQILPLVSNIATPKGLGLNVSQASSNLDLSTPLLIMILIQSFFAGLVIGKISEGSIKNGIRHSFILLAMTLLIVFSARAFFG